MTADSNEPFFDVAGWLAGELEADMEKVFTTCANLADTVLWGADELRDLVDIFNKPASERDEVEILSDDLVGEDVEIKISGKLDDQAEMWATTIKKLCKRAAALNWTMFT